MDVLHRLDVEALADKSFCEFKPMELASFLIQKFPSEPVSYLDMLKNNKDIGDLLYVRTKTILMGAGYVKREEEILRVSIKNSARGLSYKVRSAE